MKICNIIGARPQFIKVATISRVIKNRSNIKEIIIHTGQHYDNNMSDIFFSELDIPSPDYNLNIGSGLHGWQTGKMLEAIEKVLLNEKPDVVIVYGDTNSTIAGALAATKLHIPVAHVEAGLRSFNRSMPEEINRIATDKISDLLFVPTQMAMDHLKNEGLANYSFFCGDVMYDSVLHFSKKINTFTEEPYYLATIHRPANTDVIGKFSSIIKAFSKFDKKVVLPAHPRLKKVLDQIKVPDNIKIIEPVGYTKMLSLIKNADLVFTDSGGLQKECYFLKKRCVTLREETEWVETLENNCNILVGADYDKIVAAEKLKCGEFDIKTKYGLGNAAEKIIEKISEYLIQC